MKLSRIPPHLSLVVSLLGIQACGDRQLSTAPPLKLESGVPQATVAALGFTPTDNRTEINIFPAQNDTR